MDSDSETIPTQPPNLRYIKDPIHDQIPVSPKLASFIDTIQFQRLRNIKQLGTTSWVWPSATHTRFEHSLGVAYLARLIASHLQRSQPELDISDRDIDCVEIAGLCHDLGHGPWSHVWDGVFMPKALPGCKWKHEDASEMMFDALVKENGLQIPEADQKFIKALISGDHLRTGPHEKQFLFDIVANRRNGLDVDKIDYIHRDSFMVGEPIRVSLPGLINSARVLENQICYNIKHANQIYEICASRFKLHKMVYNHKSAKGIEYMIVDALLAAEPVLKFVGHKDNPSKFVHLTDHIMSEILSSDKPELAESRRIFNRILKRDLYRCVDYKVIDWPDRRVFQDNITSGTILGAVNALGVKTKLQESDIIVDFAEMHYGKNEEDPMDFMRFYSKFEPNVCRKAVPGCYSNLKPQYFMEFLLRVYTKKEEFAEIIQNGYNSILNHLHLRSRYHSADEEVDGTTRDGNLSPPTTPKASGSSLHSRRPSHTFPSSVHASGGTPFAPNQFTVLPKNRSVSPVRSVAEPDSAPSTTNATPATLGKRKRAAGVRQDSPQRPKKKR